MMAIKDLPYHSSKARFEKGDLVVLPSIIGTPIYAGVVIGKGKDKYGEHQKIKIVKTWGKKPLHKIGETAKARLMDLAWLQKFGEMPPSEIKHLTGKKLKKLQRMI